MYSVVACTEMVIYFLSRKTEQYKQVGGRRSVFGGLRFEGPQLFYFILLQSFSLVYARTQVFYSSIIKKNKLIFKYKMQTLYIHFIITRAKSNLGSSNLQKAQSLLLNRSRFLPKISP